MKEWEIIVGQGKEEKRGEVKCNDSVVICILLSRFTFVYTFVENIYRDENTMGIERVEISDPC